MQKDIQKQLFDMHYDLIKIHSYSRILLKIIQHNEEEKVKIPLLFFAEFIEKQIHFLCNRIDLFSFQDNLPPV